jgi:hypothetical protein
MEIQTVDVIHPATVVQDIALTATLPSEMVQSQHDLIEGCEKKITVSQDEVRELWDAYSRAKKMKWKDAPLRNLWRNASKRLVYYEKVKAALGAGYYIVPNFDVRFFAIRTNKNTPKDQWTVFSWNAAEHKKEAQELPIGEGEYQNPFPVVYEKSVGEGDSKKKYSRAERWDQMEFPIMMAKPDVMEATSRAMALKIFDRIGVFPNFRKEDPVIIGQVFRKVGYTTKIVSFMIAWHLDTRMI